MCSSDVFGFIADFSYNKGAKKLNLFELGNGWSAGFSGYDRLHPDKTTQALAKEKEGVHLSFSSQLWLGTNEHAVGIAGEKISHGTRNIEEIVDIPSPPIDLFLALAHTSGDTPLTLCLEQAEIGDDLHSFLNWYRRRQLLDKGPRLELHHKEFKRALESKADFVRAFGRSKILPQSCDAISINDEEISKVSQFLDGCDAEYFVLKPSNEGVGRGVEIVHRDKLISVLNEIKDNTTELDFWKSCSPQTSFVVQEFCPSSPVEGKDGQQYAPTGRLVFIPSESCEHGFPYECLNAYWKLPASALCEDNKAHNDLYISKIRKDEECSLDIDKDTLAEILEAFNAEFPKYYAALLGPESKAEWQEKFDRYQDPALRAGTIARYCFSAESEINSKDAYGSKINYLAPIKLALSMIGCPPKEEVAYKPSSEEALALVLKLVIEGTLSVSALESISIKGQELLFEGCLAKLESGEITEIQLSEQFLQIPQTATVMIQTDSSRGGSSDYAPK